jgi:uncharacterized damage-inducible protein DinB
MPANLPLSALLAYVDEEARTWDKWFRENPHAADAKIDIAHSENVRSLLNHIFAVEYRYGQFIIQQPATDFSQLNRDTLDELFRLGHDGRGNIQRFLATATDADADRPITFKTLTSGEITASARKMLTHCLIHSVRHWGQLATALRQQGHATNWKHDFMFSSALK